MTLFFSVLFSHFLWGKTLDKTVAIVNQDVILSSDIDAFQKKLKSKQFQETFGGADPSVLKTREAVLQLLIEEKIVNQQVKKLDLSITDSEVDGQIRSILAKNQITENQLKERLKQLSTPFQEYREGIRRQIERKNLVDREIKPSLEITENDLKYFYERNRPAEESGQAFQIAHIFVDGKTKNAKEKIDKIYELLKEKPENFDNLVKETSEDSSTREQGGSLGTYTFSQLAPEFKKTIPNTEVGKFTPPIETKAGYHIVKIVDGKTSDFSNLPKEKKEALRNQMLTEALEKKMSQWLERKKAESFIRVKP